MKTSIKVINRAIALLLGVFLAAGINISNVSVVLATEVNTEMNGENHLVSSTNVIAPILAAEFMALSNAPGVVMAIVDKNNDFVWTQGFGYADTTEERFVDEFTIFNLASISKSFTALAIMQLVEKGEIDLDEPLVTYLPHFSVMPCPFEGGSYENITVRMLLNHTSGIHNDFPASGILSIGGHDARFMNNFLANLSQTHMASPENVTVSYNNNAYIVLGILLASLAGCEDLFEGFADLMNERIFQPLGMNMTSFGVNPDLTEFLAMGYDEEGIQDIFLYFNGLPSGGINSNAHDMTRFMESVLRGGELDGNRVISESTLDYMLTPQEFDFVNAPHKLGNMRPGIGFHEISSVFFLDGFTFVGHSGNIVHYNSDMIFCFDNGIGVFISSNGMGALGMERIYSEFLLRSVIDELEGVLYLPEDDLTVHPIQANDYYLSDYVGVFMVAGASYFSNVFLTEDGSLAIDGLPAALAAGVYEPLVLHPLSDGSFIDGVLGLRLWFNVNDEGGILLELGAFRSAIIGSSLSIDVILNCDEFKNFIGSYVPIQVDETHVNVITYIEVGISSLGKAYLRTHTIHGVVSIMPLVQIAGGKFMGNIEFISDGENTYLYIAQNRFISE